MDERKLLKLLKVLEQTGEPAGAAECAELLGISVSSLKKELREVKQLLLEHGCMIQGKSGLGNGYELFISDRNKYDDFTKTYLPAQMKERQKSFNEQGNRIRYLMEFLLQHDGYAKGDDLADILSVSRSQFQKDLSQVKRYFENYGIHMESRSHYGMRIRGDEMAIRACIADLYEGLPFSENGSKALEMGEERDSALKRIEQIILEYSRQFQYELSDLSIQNLTVHLFVAMKRLEQQKFIQIDRHTMETARKASEYSLAKAIVNEVEQSFDVRFAEEEVCYVVMHLSAKKMVNADEPVSKEVMEIVDEMLARIREQMQMDLTSDLDLRITLGMHMMPLLKRIQYGMTAKNPLLEDIKNQFLFAYDTALCACTVLNERYHCALAADEVGYVALALKVALDRTKDVKKKTILMVCSSGRGSANLLKADFMQKFGSQISQIETCNAYELSELDLSRYDCIFTTIPVHTELPVPAFRIQAFLNAENEKKIQEILKDEEQSDLLRRCFLPDLFFTGIAASKKGEVIFELVKKIREKRELPEEFYESVMRRESLEDTLFGQIAIPHTERILMEETVIGVAVLSKPVNWGKGAARVIVLSSFAKGFISHHEQFFGFLLELSKNKSWLNRLASKPEYEMWMQLVEQYNNRKEV